MKNKSYANTVATRLMTASTLRSATSLLADKGQMTMTCTRLTKSRKRMNTLTAKNDMWPCTKCRKELPADDAMIIQDRIYCEFCTIIEHGYYKPEEHLPDEYYEELREKNKDDRENLW